MKRICAVIVNYKTADMTRDCVSSLAPQLDPARDRIVIVDNDSGQEEFTRLSSGIGTLGLGSLVTLMALKTNGGFSAGNNEGIKSADSEFYLLTNSDTLFRPGAVQALLAGAASSPKAGIIGPRLEWLDGVAQVSCFRFHRPVSEIIHSANSGPVTRMFPNHEIPVFPVESVSFPGWISFACVLVRKNVFEKVGFLDDGFFMYYEDEDFCRRTRNAGFEIMNWPDARVVHLQGKSSEVNERSSAGKRLPDYVYHSRSRYYRKHFGTPGWLFANLFWIAGRFVSLARQCFSKFPCPVPRGEFLGIWKTSSGKLSG